MRSDERGSVEERAKQNTGHKLEVKNKDLLRIFFEVFYIRLEKTGFHLLK